jgi:hypothetical protein
LFINNQIPDGQSYESRNHNDAEIDQPPGKAGCSRDCQSRNQDHCGDYDGQHGTGPDTTMTQTERLYNLLKDNLPHRTDEILRVVYGSEHNGIARIGARIADLKAGKWPGQVRCTIEGYHDPQTPRCIFIHSFRRGRSNCRRPSSQKSLFLRREIKHYFNDHILLSLNPEFRHPSPLRIRPDRFRRSGETARTEIPFRNSGTSGVLLQDPVLHLFRMNRGTLFEQRLR